MSALPELVRRPTAVDLFRFSAATWNAHRIHYDADHARQEGLPGVVVQAHLHGAYLAQVVLAFGGPRSRLVELEWRNRRPAVAGETLRYGGTVERVTEDPQARRLQCTLEGRRSDGEVCVTGSATLMVPKDAA